MYEPHWTSYITALTIPVIAIVAAIIAYRQWRTAQSKLKLDLFEKRMVVYQAARDMLGYVGLTCPLSQGHLLLSRVQVGEHTAPVGQISIGGRTRQNTFVAEHGGELGGRAFWQGAYGRTSL